MLTCVCVSVVSVCERVCVCVCVCMCGVCVGMAGVEFAIWMCCVYRYMSNM